MVYILANSPEIIQTELGVLVFRVNYRLTETVNGNNDGTVDVVVDNNKTETEQNVAIAAALATEANLQANTTQFTADSVKGGRI